MKTSTAPRPVAPTPKKTAQAVATRLAAALVRVPAWQMAAAVILLLPAIYLLLRAGARRCRNAALHTGARLRLRQAWRSEPGQAQPVQR